MVLRIGNSAIRYRHRPLPAHFIARPMALNVHIQAGLFARVASVQEAGIGYLSFRVARIIIS
jgi:hypothetical protein